MRIPRYEESFEEERVLEFRLENGMGQLASLQQLVTIGFGDTQRHIPYFPQMGQRDVIWMLANWMKLRTIGGQLNDDPTENRRLKGVLKVLGYKTEF
jgi:hypothetical protein